MDLCIGYNLKDGTEHTISSYNAEIQGQLALLLMATCLVQKFQVTNLSFLLTCDNLGALKCLQYTSPHIDLITTFQEWTSYKGIKWSSKWIKGHHQDSTTKPDNMSDLALLLNVQMDKLTEKAYRSKVTRLHPLDKGATCRKVGHIYGWQKNYDTPHHNLPSKLWELEMIFCIIL